MKRLICLLLALCLPFALSAGADEEDWIVHNSVFGFSMPYPVLMMKAYSIPREEIGYDMEVWEPTESGTGAYLTCCLSQDPSWPNWTSYGYTQQETDEPGVEMEEVVLDMKYRLYLSPDGGEYVEEVRLKSPMRAFGYPAGFEYVFDLHYTAADPDAWRLTYESMLNGVEFPWQGAHAGSFDVLFTPDCDLPFTDVILAADASPVYLYPAAGVTDFVLEKVEWDDETMTQTGAQPLYTAERFTGAECLRIYSYSPEFLPDLRIRCLSPEGEPETWYIFQNDGRDGSLLLMPEDE